MQENLTLTVDEDVLREARKIAQERNTSVDELVREYLASLISEASDWAASARQFEELARRSPARVGDVTWTRDELHERR